MQLILKRTDEMQKLKCSRRGDCKFKMFDDTCCYTKECLDREKSAEFCVSADKVLKRQIKRAGKSNTV